MAAIPAATASVAAAVTKHRIASFLPAATEMLYSLGLGDQVVGVTHECDYPPECKQVRNFEKKDREREREKSRGQHPFNFSQTHAPHTNIETSPC